MKTADYEKLHKAHGGSQLFDLYMKQFDATKMGLPVFPTINTDPKLNDNELRHLPKNLTEHDSVRWFNSPIKNKF